MACGNLKNRGEIISLPRALPGVGTVSDDEILYFIEERQLMGSGIGIVDAHLLASSKMANIPIWTYDRRLKETAKRLGTLYKAPLPS